MVMPNIGAFIAWGFLTAIFLSPGGWFPNENIVSIQPFMLHFLIPVLIAYTGGKMMGGDRGGVMGAISIMGCVAGVATYDTGGGIIVGQPMLMGAMIMGPVAGILIKKFDEAIRAERGVDRAREKQLQLMKQIYSNEYEVQHHPKNY